MAVDPPPRDPDVEPVPTRDAGPVEGPYEPGEEPFDDASTMVRLDPDQCWQHLRGSRTGRVAFRSGDSLEVIPVNYVSEDRRVVFSTSSSTILAAVHEHREFVFEADEHDGWTAWSVVVHGRPTIPETRQVTARRLRSMLPTPKTATVVIEPTSVTGRLFDQAAP